MLCCAALQKGDAASKLAISDLNSPAVYIYDVASGSETAIATLEKLHTAPVKVMRFNAVANTVISSDAKGGQCARCLCLDGCYDRHAYCGLVY